MSRQVPAGWPGEVPPPGAPDWERKAVAWLYDLCPPDHRGYAVLRAHPVLLARVAHEHVQASIAACKRGASTARADLGPRGESGVTVAPEVIEALIAMYEAEALRLETALRATVHVQYALAGKRFTPKL